MKSVKYSKTLVALNVASNELTNEGLSSLFKALILNESLVDLNIATLDGVARNRMSLNGVTLLKDLLATNRFLCILDISSTGIGNEGFSLICDVLGDEESASNHSL
jgi:hypothetical protein